MITSRSIAAMGTVATIAVRGAWGEDADRAFAWFDDVERACSRFDAESELTRLVSTPGRTAIVSPLLFHAVAFAVELARETNGAFDPTIGAASAARRRARHYLTGARVPQLADADPHASYLDVECDPRTHRITLHRLLPLDLGAVAKGLAVDLAARALAAREGFVIDAGGDIFAGGQTPTGEPWRIGIRNPRAPREVSDVVEVSNRAVCTSALYEQPGHIVDARVRPARREAPRPARAAAAPPADLMSATVIASSAMAADGLATAVMALGRADGLALCDRAGVDAIVYAA